jgi:hypothetical protein
MTSQKIRTYSMTMLQKKHKRQQRNRRGGTLLKKAYELSIMADADVFLGIRFRDTGRIKTFCADTTGIWSSHLSHLVSFLTTLYAELIETGFILSYSGT